MTYLLGFNHQVGLEFLLVTGLIKKGSIRNPLGYSVLPNEWENFVIGENLKEVMKTTVTVTSVDRSRYYFIHYGNQDQSAASESIVGVASQGCFPDALKKDSLKVNEE